MLTAVEVYQRVRPRLIVKCAKLDHPAHVPCIHCGYQPPGQVRHEAMDFVLAGDRNARILRWPATSLLLKKASCLAGDVPVAPTRSDASRSVSLRCCALVGYGPSP